MSGALDAVARAHGWDVARGFRARLVGWIGRGALDPQAGLCLPACRAVHTFGMRVAIDVVFVDRHLRVVRCVPALAPRRLAAAPGAFAVIELPAGAAARRGLRPGRVLGPDSTLKELSQ